MFAKEQTTTWEMEIEDLTVIMMIRSNAFIVIVFIKMNAKRNISSCQLSFFLAYGRFLTSYRTFNLSSCEDNIIWSDQKVVTKAIATRSKKLTTYNNIQQQKQQKIVSYAVLETYYFNTALQIEQLSRYCFWFEIKYHYLRKKPKPLKQISDNATTIK